jgi:hypothetical protein
MAAAKNSSNVVLLVTKNSCLRARCLSRTMQGHRASSLTKRDVLCPVLSRPDAQACTGNSVTGLEI